MRAISSVFSLGSPIGFKVKIYPKPQKLPSGLSVKKLTVLDHYWNIYTIEDPNCQCPNDGSFEVKRLLYLKKKLSNFLIGIYGKIKLKGGKKFFRSSIVILSSL